MNIKIITDVSTEPVTLTQAKAHLRVEDTDDDTYITTLITIAREYCETVTKRALATQTLELILDDFPCSDYIKLPMSPVQSVTSVKYTDSDGSESTWSSANYVTNLDVVPAIITPAYAETYPSFTPLPTGAVRVRYVAGHKSDGVALPKAIYHAILLLIGHLYENREETTTVTLENIPMGIQSLLYNYRVVNFHESR
jgi:uncharacterized phiE125 gp8 family phage protein